MTHQTIASLEQKVAETKAAEALSILNDSLSYFDADTTAAYPAEDIADQSAAAYYQAA